MKVMTFQETNNIVPFPGKLQQFYNVDTVLIKWREKRKLSGEFLKSFEREKQTKPNQTNRWLTGNVILTFNFWPHTNPINYFEALFHSVKYWQWKFGFKLKVILHDANEQYKIIIKVGKKPHMALQGLYQGMNFGTIQYSDIYDLLWWNWEQVASDIWFEI